MPIRRKTGEKKDEFVARCIAKEVSSGMKEDQAAAVCYAMWEDKQLSAIRNIRNKEDQWIVDYFSSGERGIDISELGLTEEDFEQAQQFDVDTENFSIAEEDATDDEVTYYRYIGPISKNSRRFCRTLVSEVGEKSGRVMRYEDIIDLNTAPKKGKYQRALRAGGGNYSIFKYRGGVNCRHKWVKYRYDVKKGELVKGRVQPKQDEVGHIKKDK